MDIPLSAWTSAIDQKITRAKLIQKRSGTECYAWIKDSSPIEVACYTGVSSRYTLERIDFGTSLMHTITAFSPLLVSGRDILLASYGTAIFTNPQTGDDGIVMRVVEKVTPKRKLIDVYDYFPLKATDKNIDSFAKYYMLNAYDARQSIEECLLDNIPKVNSLFQSLNDAAPAEFVYQDVPPREIFGAVSQWFGHREGRTSILDLIGKQSRWVQVYSIGKNALASLDMDDIYQQLRMYHPPKGQPGANLVDINMVFKTPNRMESIFQRLDIEMVTEPVLYELEQNKSGSAKKLVEFFCSGLPWTSIEEGSFSDQEKRIIIKEREFTGLLDGTYSPGEGIKGLAMVGHDLMKIYLFSQRDDRGQPFLIYSEDKEMDLAKFRMKGSIYDKKP